MSFTKPIVRVTWHDAQDNNSTWANEKDVEEWGSTSCVIVSVGFLVSKTERYVTLAADWDDEDKNYGRITKIPAQMVQELQELREIGHQSLDAAGKK